MEKSRKARQRSNGKIIINPVPLEEDEADFLISQEREQADAALPWRTQVLGPAQKEYGARSSTVRQQALALIDRLSANPLPNDAAPLQGHRGYYGIRFCRNQFRMIYRVSRPQRTIVVTRIRRQGDVTYLGYEEGVGTPELAH